MLLFTPHIHISTTKLLYFLSFVHPFNLKSLFPFPSFLTPQLHTDKHTQRTHHTRSFPSTPYNTTKVLESKHATVPTPYPPPPFYPSHHPHLAALPLFNISTPPTHQPYPKCYSPLAETVLDPQSSTRGAQFSTPRSPGLQCAF